MMLLPLLLVLSQAGAPAGAGVLQGRVVDAATNRPLSAVMVSLGGAGLTVNPLPGQTPVILTGSDGRFVFSGLPVPGSFSVTTSKGGYADGASGRRRPGGTTQPVQLSAPASSADIVVRMWKNGTIAGTVIDEAGEQMIAVQVQLLRRSSGEHLQRASAPQTTDDRGTYRFSNLLPGDYVVVASLPAVAVKPTVFDDLVRTGRPPAEFGMALVSMRSSTAEILQVGDAWIAIRPGSPIPTQIPGGRFRAYPPTFHPSAASSAQATVVPLAAGEERSSIDIQLMPVSTAQVSGLVVNPAASGPGGLAVRLFSASNADVPQEAFGPITGTDSTGAFAFAGVPPGQYTLAVSAGQGPDMTVAHVPLTVGGDDVPGVIATLAPAPAVSGRYQFEGITPRPAGPNGRPLSIQVFLLPVDPLPMIAGSVVWSENGFTVRAYAPGRYRVSVPNSPPGWMFKGAMLNGVDVTETPFDLARDVTDLTLVFTDRWSGLSGAVQGANADGATVLVFPTDSQSWVNAGPANRRIKSARVGSDGRFGIGSLPPGDYYAIAVPEEDAANWRDPAEALDGFARLATRVTIMEGEHKTLDLQVREVRR